jgi:hypothetical protein
MRNAWGGLSSKSGGETSYLGDEGSNVEVNQPLGEGVRPLMRQGLRSNAREHLPRKDARVVCLASSTPKLVLKLDFLKITFKTWGIEGNYFANSSQTYGK